MGQMFKACAYDTVTKTCCVIDADKFHANCYSYSGPVSSMHYLLRQQPYRIMWGGDYAVHSGSLAKFSRTEDLLGISTYKNCSNVDDEQRKKYADKVNVIDENRSLWKKVDVWDEALAYFDWENTRSVKYSGYLLNHTQKLAVDLADYHKQSKFLSKNWAVAIDLVPVLTETGGGTQMALDNGISVSSTEKLVGTWCGDLLQIVDELPENYNLINCCFAEIWSRAEYCHRTFGLNENGCLLSDGNGNLFEATRLSLRGERQSLYTMKVETNEEKIRFIPIAKQAA